MRRTLLPTIALAIAVSGATAVAANAGDRGGDRDKPGTGRDGRVATAAHPGGGGHPGGGHGGGGHPAAATGGGPGGGGGGGTPQKTATAIGTGGAAATVDLLATDAAIDMLRSGGNAVDAAVAAAGVLGVTEPFSAGIGGGGFMVIRTPRGQVTTIDSRETAPARHAAGLVLSRTARRCRSTTRARADSPPASRARWPAGSTRSQRYGTQVAAQGARAGIEVARKGFVVDQTFFDQTHAERRLLQRRPVDGRDLPRPRRHAARRRHHAAQPGHGEGVRVIARYGADALLPRPDRAGDRRGRAAARRSPPTPNHTWRPRPDHRERPRALPRARARSRRGSATRASTCGAWARRPAAARPSARR